MRIKPQDKATSIKLYPNREKLFHQVRSDVDFIGLKCCLVGRKGNALVAKFRRATCQIQ